MKRGASVCWVKRNNRGSELRCWIFFLFPDPFRSESCSKLADKSNENVAYCVDGVRLSESSKLCGSSENIPGGK